MAGMECPVCQAANAAGQKFCGACGYRLEANCVRCSASNPSHYQYCGQCGSSLAVAGTVVLARSGLILEVDQAALDLLGYRKYELQGKPFSLFVARSDLVILFSHLNELRSHSKRQVFEITLKGAADQPLYALVSCRMRPDAPAERGEVLLMVSKADESRQASARLQYQQDLLHLIFDAADKLGAVSGAHLDVALADVLKKIGLFAKADHAFIYALNRKLRRLESVCSWHQPDALPQGTASGLKSVSLVLVKRTIVRLRRAGALVVNKVENMSPAERYELLAWHQADLGSLVAHLIYRDRRPVGVIGLARKKARGEWPPECVALVKLCGQLAGRCLPPAGAGESPVDRPRSATPGIPAEIPAPKPSPVADVIQFRPVKPPVSGSAPPSPAGKKEARPSEAQDRHVPDEGRPMRFEKAAAGQAVNPQRVYARDDGLILLTCPRCGHKESVSIGRLQNLGNAVAVHCSCKKQFVAVLEKRRSRRKAVLLEGYFTSDVGPGMEKDAESKWGPMVVKDLSKTGLRFTSAKAHLVKAGDRLMVRFNLDNSNRALIHKPATVVSVDDREVGCRFEGADNYDITLGFYFI